MVTHLWNCGSAQLLVTLLLSNGLRICDSTRTLEEDEETFTHENRTRPEVIIPQGRVCGVNMITRHGRNIFGFMGIPFAKPPVGKLRFKGPVPPEPWNGILDASKESSPCPQLKGHVVIGDEDCLYLRVFTPQLPESENSALLPVMVFIYGGGFNVGTADSERWGPHFILDKDVILVIPTYRIGVLGFLSTGDEVSPGNYGLKDIVQALKWNQDNIRYFGGDPDQVTIFGGSSGGMTTEILTLSNLTNGLFHRYIMQSGSAFCFDAQRVKSSFSTRAVHLGKYLGCPTNTSSILVECLRDIDTSKLVKTVNIFYIWGELPINIWGPTGEPDIEGALLTDTPANLLAAGKNRDLPRLVSVTSEEGVYYHAVFQTKLELLEDFSNKVDIVLPAIAAYSTLVNNVTAYTAALKSYYLNDWTADRNLLLKNITQLMGDALFNYPIYRSLQQHLRYRKSPQYLCSFQYPGTLSHSYGFTRDASVKWGVVHGDETIYLFRSPNGLYGPPEWEMNETDWKMVDIMVQLWTSFATNGIPTMTDPNDAIIWEPYSPRKNHLRIGSNSDISLEVEYNFFEDRAQFWQELTANTTWKKNQYQFLFWSWNGTLHASRETNPCVQFIASAARGDEDCLYLNVYTPQLVKNFTQLMGDGEFSYPIYRSLQHHLQDRKSPQYLYTFEYRGIFSNSYGLTRDASVNWGAVHGDETIYLFPNPLGLYGPPEWERTETDWKMVDTMVQLWTSFAINGTPTTADPNNTIIWEPYSLRKSHLRIGSNSDTLLAVGYNFFQDRAQFWQELVAKTSRK